MTTIVYEGSTRTLYTDSLVTTTMAGVTTRTDMTFKVEDLSRFKLVAKDGQKVIGIAFSGTIAVFTRITKFLLANLLEWNGAVDRLVDEGMSLGDFAGSAVLLITNKELHCFDFKANAMTHEALPLNENVCFGSGSAFAKTAMEVYGANGFDAIAAASMCDPNTGSLIHAYKVRAGKLVPVDTVLYRDSKEVRVQMRKRAARSTMHLKMTDPFKHSPENILVRLDNCPALMKQIRERHAPPGMEVPVLQKTTKKR